VNYMNRLKKYHIERIKSGDLTDEEKQLQKYIEDELKNVKYTGKKFES
jgi:hypothetical protein